VAPNDLPEPAPNFELNRSLGAWYVLASNRPCFRARTHPRVDFEPLSPDEHGHARLSGALRFCSPDLLGRAQPRLELEVAVAEGERPGQFRVGGRGLARLGARQFCFALLDPKSRWAAIWHARSKLGSAAGLDLCSRDPTLSQAKIDAILAEVYGHVFLASADRPGQPLRCAGLVALPHHWIPPEPYRLEPPRS
jgi:hypothetical protein